MWRDRLLWAIFVASMFGAAHQAWQLGKAIAKAMRLRRPQPPDTLVPDGWKRWHAIPERHEARLFIWRKGRWHRTNQVISLAEIEEHET